MFKSLDTADKGFLSEKEIAPLNSNIFETFPRLRNGESESATQCICFGILHYALYVLNANDVAVEAPVKSITACDRRGRAGWSAAVRAGAAQAQGSDDGVPGADATARRHG